MALAYVTGAMASGFAAAGLTALVVWAITVITGSDDPWAFAPWIVAAVALIFAAATYAAEGIVHRRTLARMRATGEPWAFREGG